MILTLPLTAPAASLTAPFVWLAASFTLSVMSCVHEALQVRCCTAQRFAGKPQWKLE